MIMIMMLIISMAIQFNDGGMKADDGDGNDVNDDVDVNDNNDNQ